MKNSIELFGAAIDACANIRGAASTPEILKPELAKLGLAFKEILPYNASQRETKLLHTYFTNLAKKVELAMLHDHMPIIIGGDHSCAIGSWSGVSHRLNRTDETLGLIWIDAHMDAHTPKTTTTGNIHGMPVASLLGHGDPLLTSILDENPKILPENIILIGIRSYEEGEANLLKKLGVQVYYNTDVQKLGFPTVFDNAWNRLLSQVDQIGLSIDLDGFDPEFTPGVATPEPNGVDFKAFMDKLKTLPRDKLVALEITEGNPLFDQDNKTMKCIVSIIKATMALS